MFVSLCATALAAIAMTGSVASIAAAEEPITVAPAIVCDPCIVHIVGESSLAVFHVITVSRCTDELFADVHSDGSGQVNTWTGVSDGDPGCTREQCADDGGVREPWPLDTEEVAAQVVELDLEFCLSPVGNMVDAAKVKCDVPATVIEQTGNDHHYDIAIDHECSFGGTPVEVRADWQTEATHNPAEETEVELIHGS